MQLEKGKRVYMSDTKTYGHVVRTGMLGLKSDSFVVMSDSGVSRAYVGSNATVHIVDPCDGCNKKGDPHDLPLDVLTEVCPVLCSSGVSANRRMNFVQEFYKLPEEKQKGYQSKWRHAECCEDAACSMISEVLTKKTI